MDLGRYKDSLVESGSALPAEWTESLVKVLTETYFKQSEKDNCFFDVYGKVFDQEFIVIISYIHHEDQMASPISVFISHDNLEDSKKMKQALASLVDLAGHIFDDIFSIADWNGYIPNWTENKFKENTFFYKITRENISLTLQAEEILKKGSVI